MKLYLNISPISEVTSDVPDSLVNNFIKIPFQKLILELYILCMLNSKHAVAICF